MALFDRLYNKSESGALTWKETVQDDMFSVAFKDFSVSIRPVAVDFDEIDYYFEIRNENGEVVDQFKDTELSQLCSSDVERKALFKKVETLYEIARRNARGADKALTSILKQLDEDFPF
ncbi:hypothetical protein [Ferrovibrio terrae]|uniref:hypothetical protein n=1 Tax=Ferrovibrio terrae TaxID=2594003 RepID=UPI003137ED46